MKADLYIGNKPPASVELLSAPRSGELIIFGGQEFAINEVAHDADKRKLRIKADAKPKEQSADEWIINAVRNVTDPHDKEVADE